MSGITLSNLSTQSSDMQCRICHDNRHCEELISPCKCTGTLAFVHISCLERWINQSARTSCELCQYDFKTEKTIRSFKEWIFADDVPRDERRDRIVLLICYLLLTSFAVASIWLCMKNAVKFYANEHFSNVILLLSLAVLVIILYTFFLAITIRYYYMCYKYWQMSTMQVRLVLSNYKMGAKPNDIDIFREDDKEELATATVGNHIQITDQEICQISTV